MNLDRCSRLTLSPIGGVWFRTVELQHLERSLSAAHTTEQPSRFSAGPDAAQPFEILYLCENTLVAHCEVGALLGNPWDPGGAVSRPGLPWVDINVTVRLQFVADLTRVSEQRRIRTHVQELTGDWRGFALRSGRTTVSEPVGLAPTQRLGAALFAVPRLEAFLSVSGRVPYHRNLNVFPDKLQPGSQLLFEYPARDIRVEIKPPARRTATRGREARE